MRTGQTFGDVLRGQRIAAQLTQEELAERAGLSPRSISDLERGINRTARKETARLLAAALALEEPVRSEFMTLARGLAVESGPRASEQRGTLHGTRTAHLEIWQPSGIRVLPLGSTRVTIGRGEGNDVALVHDKTASRLHAVLDPVGTGWCLQDAGSRNGTFVRGEPVVGMRMLRHGDEVTVGASKLVYREQNPADITQTEGVGSRRVERAVEAVGRDAVPLAHLTDPPP